MSGTLVAVAVSALAAIEENARVASIVAIATAMRFFMTIFQKFMEVLF
jgi:hypothetical protein